jgi:hypothetical protein
MTGYTNVADIVQQMNRLVVKAKNGEEIGE